MPDGAPSISVMIPARNEAAVIAEAVRKVLRQTYHRFEFLLLDDHSDDGTSAVAQESTGSDSRFHILDGSPILPDWLGKNWACEQLAARAKGETLIFVDADVHWQPDALAALLCKLEQSGADMLAVWPTQHTVTWAERCCVSLMAFAIHAYLPVLGVHYTRYALLAASNGQSLDFRWRAYRLLGGHAAVRGKVLDDVGLARLAKKAGLRLRMAEADGLITCRMYRDWLSVRDGFAKNILAGYGNAAGLVVGTVFHWLVFLAPWLLLGLGIARAQMPGHPSWALLLISAGLAVRAFTAWRSGQRVGDALLLPVSVLLMTCIFAQALWWQLRYGGPLWKGRRAVP